MIYVASSWRNPYYPEVVKRLREEGNRLHPRDGRAGTDVQTVRRGGGRPGCAGSVALLVVIRIVDTLHIGLTVADFIGECY